jgi:hypothetical protein
MAIRAMPWRHHGGEKKLKPLQYKSWLGCGIFVLSCVELVAEQKHNKIQNGSAI